jgi:copper chaperone CopZ
VREGRVVVQGMTCADCGAKVKRRLLALPGVGTVEVDLGSGLVTLRWGADFAGLDEVKGAIAELGYEVKP